MRGSAEGKERRCGEGGAAARGGSVVQGLGGVGRVGGEVGAERGAPEIEVMAFKIFGVIP